MGRVKDFKELGKKGPGRRAKKQGNPELEGAFKVLANVDEGKVLKKKPGGRIKQRTRKRELKKAATDLIKLKSKRGKKKQIVDEEPTSDGLENEFEPMEQEMSNQKDEGEGISPKHSHN